MKFYVLSGYIYGVCWALLYGFFRWQDRSTLAEHLFTVIVGSLTFGGAIGAIGGLIAGAGLLLIQRLRASSRAAQKAPTRT